MDENESITQELRDFTFYFPHLRGVADRIDERFTHELEAKQEEIDGLRSDNTKLQAKLDASIQLPVDADGVPWTCREYEFIADTDERCRLLGVLHSVEGGDFLEVDDGSGRYFIANACHHVAPEPHDSQERIDADAGTIEDDMLDGAFEYCMDHGIEVTTDSADSYIYARAYGDLLHRQRELDEAGDQS